MIDELELLREVFAADPHVDAPEVAASVKTRILAALEEESAAEVHEEQPPSSTAPPSLVRVRRRRVLVGAVAAGLAAAVTAGVVVGLDQRPPSASAAPVTPVPLAFHPGGAGSGVAVLLAAADHVLEAAPPSPSLPVRYFRTTQWSLDVNHGQGGSTPYLVEDVRQTWQSPDGSDDVSDHGQPATRLGVPVGGPGPTPSTDVSGHYGPGTWLQVDDGLPTTVTGLRTALTPQGSTPNDPSIPTAAAADAVNGAATPALLAAIYRLVAQAPGVFAAGTVTDNDGRTGVAVGFDGTLPGSPSGFRRSEYLVLDPTDGQPLENEEVVSPGRILDPSLGSGSYVDLFTTLDESANVQEVGDQ